MSCSYGEEIARLEPHSVVEHDDLNEHGVHVLLLMQEPCEKLVTVVVLRHPCHRDHH